MRRMINPINRVREIQLADLSAGDAAGVGDQTDYTYFINPGEAVQLGASLYADHDVSLKIFSKHPGTFATYQANTTRAATYSGYLPIFDSAVGSMVHIASTTDVDSDMWIQCDAVGNLWICENTNN